MGLFFEGQGSNSPLVPILETAYKETPPPDDLLGTTTRSLATSFNPVEAAVHSALRTNPPADPNAAAKSSAQAVANALSGNATFKGQRFAVALLIFLALLGTAIGCDASGLTSSTTALYSLVSSVFGVIVGFLGGEKGA